MFVNIKRKFLALNMIIISILMFLMGIAVYASMRFNILSSINEDMTIIEEEYQNYFYIPHFRETMSVKSSIGEDKFYFVEDIGIKHNTSFSNESNIYNEELKSEITNFCMNVDADNGIINYKDKYYYFSKIHFLEDDGVRLIVLSVTDRIHLLNKLAVDMSAVGGLALFIIFLISKFFTNKSMKPVEEAFSKQKNFISDASHELKTPLAVINTNIDVVLRSDELQEEDKKWLSYAKEEVKQMSVMVNEFLYLARMESDVDIKACQEIDASSIISGVILSMEAVAYEKNIIISDDIEDDIFVVANEAEFKRLIKILVDNAIKYADSGGKVVVSLNKENHNGVFIIRNTGTVIDKKDGQVIFERFYRANKERERASQSYGLGLSIAKSTCEKYGFNIKAYPENNMTCFKLSFKNSNKVTNKV